MLAADTMDRLHDAGGAEQGIPARLHRRRAGMGLLAGDDKVEPALPVCSGHHTDRLPFLLQDRALLDVELEVRCHLVHRHPITTAIADSLQFGSEASAMRVRGR